MKYSLNDIRAIYELPITTLIFRAQEAHHRNQDPSGVQLCTLKSIKTGACPEDCKYCPQSVHSDTGLETESLLDTETILVDAREAKEGGATRFCMGAAWRKVPYGKQFDSLLDTVRSISGMGLEVCCTLGSLDQEQAYALKEAGCRVYNHNLDTSREYYGEIITTRTFDERLDNIAKVRNAGMEVCSGGIIGMGESVDDRLKMLQELANMEPYPESVPINALIACKGTPLESRQFVDSFEFARIIATTRILMPKTMVRLSAGRSEMSPELQALCFIAGANSIFLGDKLLTAANPEKSEDLELLGKLGLSSLDPDEARAIHAGSEKRADDYVLQE